MGNFYKIPAALRLIGSLCIIYSRVAVKILPGNPFGSLLEREGLILDYFAGAFGPRLDLPWPNHGI